jgi:hypothetical protein
MGHGGIQVRGWDNDICVSLAHALGKASVKEAELSTQIQTEIVEMKHYKTLAVTLAACTVVTGWPLLASAQKSGEQAQIKDSAAAPEDYENIGWGIRI